MLIARATMLCFAFCLVSCGGGDDGTNAVSSETITYALPGDSVFPESVAYQSWTGDFFVGSVKDGTIFRGHVGEPGFEVFSPSGADGRTIATGLQADDTRLFVAGRQTGQMFVYEIATGELLAKFDSGLPEGDTWINDVAIAPDGSAYFTDSVNPVLYRVSQGDDGTYALEEFLHFDGTPIQYQKLPGAAGINVNGIVVSSDGKSLIVGKRNENQQFRIDIQTKTIMPLNLEQGSLTNPDGLVLDGCAFYVIQNTGELVIIKLSPLSEEEFSGTVVRTITDPTFAFPTGIAKYDDRILVVNSQFNTRGSPAAVTGTDPPDLPFRVSDIPIDDAATLADCGP